MTKYDFLIVGAGFAGSTAARKLADAGARVLIIDKRNHVGGNAYDTFYENGALYHPYGPHIFHTNDKDVFTFLSRFTDWRFYEHRVQAYVNGKNIYVPMPINRTTLNMLLGTNMLTDGHVKNFLDKERLHISNPITSEEYLLSTIGKTLTDLFFRGYTQKQWGRDLSELSKSVAARVPVRLDDDDRYFTDIYQFMPANGYAPMFNRMLDHHFITIKTNTSLDDVARRDYPNIIYTGPIDGWFNHCLGKLPYRSLTFAHSLHTKQRVQPAAVVNQIDVRIPHTRSTEWNWITGDDHANSVVTYEFPTEDGDPYYPVPHPDNAVLYKRYEELASELPNVHFLGRLGTYKYYNMDQVVAQSLAFCKKIGV